MQEGTFTLDDFRKQFAQLAKMGPLKDVLGAMPGMSDMIPEGEDPEVGLQPHPGHDRLDDEGGAPQPRHHRPEPPAPHRRGLRRRAERDQAVPQPVRPDPHAHGARWPR